MATPKGSPLPAVLAPVRKRFLMPEAVLVSRKRKGVALALAAAADILQVGLFPLFIEGGVSPFDAALDAVMVVALVLILGFRWRLVFALAAELVPGLDMFPSWTAVVLSVASAPSEAAKEKAEEKKPLPEAAVP